jgi:hypothetical protein
VRLNLTNVHLDTNLLELVVGAGYPIGVTQQMLGESL